MAFPASSYTKDRAWREICSLAIGMRDAVQVLRDKAAAGSTSLADYIRLHTKLVAGLNAWSVLVQTPGLQAYAQDAINDPALDLVAEYQAMRSATVAVRDWISTNGEGTGLVVTTTESAGFLVVADAMIATVG